MTTDEAREDARRRLIRLDKAWRALYDALREDGDFDEAHDERCPFRCLQGDCSHHHTCKYCAELTGDLLPVKATAPAARVARSTEPPPPRAREAAGAVRACGC